MQQRSIPSLEERFPDLLNARQVIKTEREQLFAGAALPPEQLQGVGLTFSGGGIRSASFGLGVFQALLSEGVFGKIDYLSTVSGGGYLGAAISWIRKLTSTPTSEDCDAFAQQFGSAAIGVRAGDDENKSRGSEAPDERRNVWLDYIRTHGNFLQIPRIGDLALLANALRGALFNLFIYGGVLTALFAMLQIAGVLPDDYPTGWYEWYQIQSFVLLFGLLFGFSVLSYGTATWLASMQIGVTYVVGALIVAGAGAGAYAIFRQQWFELLQAPHSMHWRWPLAVAAAVVCLLSLVLWVQALAGARVRVNGRPSQGWHYKARVTYAQWLGLFSALFIAALVVWSIPLVHYELRQWLGDKSGKLFATLSSLVGMAGGVRQFFVGRSERATSSTFATLRISLSVVLLIYGLGLVACDLGTALEEQGWPLIFCVLALAVIGGFLINTNYFGLGRIYRDRLMEAFMPNRETVKTNRWAPATEADEAALQDFRLAPEGGVRRPLHLINCNVVMIDSPEDGFRGRGGDSFVLSPLFSGSDATGYIPSGRIGGGGALSLASAVAISGAAANPNTGVAGRGVTRNRLVAFLMSILNIRLGYWISNPRRRTASPPRLWPNLWLPGLVQGLFGSHLNENAAFIELTDGGHFENTGVYELIRRRTRLIILVQAGQDSLYQMEDLANAIERVRVDFGTHIRFDEADWNLDGIRPPSLTGHATRGFAIGTIRYPVIPQVSGRAPQYIDGAILYIQATPTPDIYPDTDSYRRRFPEFPNQTTADQFFEEEQLEAYRELGLRIGRQALSTVRINTLSRYLPLVAFRDLFA